MTLSQNRRNHIAGQHREMAPPQDELASIQCSSQNYLLAEGFRHVFVSWWNLCHWLFDKFVSTGCTIVQPGKTYSLILIMATFTFQCTYNEHTTYLSEVQNRSDTVYDDTTLHTVTSRYKRKGVHCDSLIVTGCIKGCRFDRLQIMWW